MKTRAPYHYLVEGILSAFLIIVMAIMIIPFINIIATSFASTEEIVSNPFLLMPKVWTLQSYNYMFTVSTSTIRALKVSVAITLISMAVAMTMTSLTAYGLSFKFFTGRKILLTLITFTMIFNPGFIAYYLTYMKYGLINRYVSLILPAAINVFYLLLLKNFFIEIPQELKEAAVIDGCSAIGIFFRLVLPLSKPALATFTLFYAVDRWNQYFDAMLYMSDPEKWPIPVLLRQIVLMAQSSSDDLFIAPTALRMATVVISILPILALYPFLQRYFQSGMMAGAIKG